MHIIVAELTTLALFTRNIDFRLDITPNYRKKNLFTVFTSRTIAITREGCVGILGLFTSDRSQ